MRQSAPSGIATVPRRVLGGLLLVLLAVCLPLVAMAQATPPGLPRVAPAGAWLPLPPAERALTRIGVGSCLHQSQPQPIWSAIIASRPQLFLMLGDNVYGVVKGADMAELVAAYRTQAVHPEFQAARAALPFHAYVGAGVRWALAQDRLAPTDYSDARIPNGGTPGFFLLDLRSGVRVPNVGALFAAIENVGDLAYRHHGSAILGPGRSLILGADFGW